MSDFPLTSALVRLAPWWPCLAAGGLSTAGSPTALKFEHCPTRALEMGGADGYAAMGGADRYAACLLAYLSSDDDD